MTDDLSELRRAVRERRGYEFAFQEVSVRSTALVLIDLTDLFFGHDETDVHPEDAQVRKALFSAFFPGASTAEALLRERGVENVVIGGVVTDVCVEASARDAFSCGFRTILLSDGCRGSSPTAHESTLSTFHRLFGDVRSIEEVRSLVMGT